MKKPVVVLVAAALLLGAAASWSWRSGAPAPPEAQPRIVLVDPQGTPLPEPLQAALRQTSGLGPVGEGRPGRAGPGYRFQNGVARLPVGEYELRLFDPRTAQMVPGARCTVAPGQVELRLPVATRDRVVRLQLRNLPGDGYVLKTVHESGRSSKDPGRSDGRHTLLLPPGPCVATVTTGSPERPQQFEHVFTVAEAVEQEVVWDVPVPR